MSKFKIDSNHKPSYQHCLNIIEQYQTLFDIQCFTQIAASISDLYYRHGELTNFIRSISSTLGINPKNQKLLIKTVEKIIEDSKSNELVSHKKLTKMNHANE